MAQCGHIKLETESSKAGGYSLAHLAVDPLWAQNSRKDEELSRDASSVEDKDTVKAANGRTYHSLNAGTYWLPNDIDEQSRLNLQHNLCSLLLAGKSHLAPIDQPRQVLDVGTGTGIWALEFAQHHPEATVYGSDLSEIQPHTNTPNCIFIKSDVEKDEWKFSHPLDFIHLRYMVTCFDEPRKVIAKAYDSMAAGGYIEFLDAHPRYIPISGTAEDTVFDEWRIAMYAAANKLNRDMSKPLKYKKWLEEAGFVDVVQKILPVPIGEWPEDPIQKEIGRLCLINMLRVMDVLKHMLVASGVSQDQVDDLTARVQAGMRSPSTIGYHEILVVYGKKP